MENQNEKTSLKELFQSMVPKGAALMQGTVTQASPIKIQIVNDEKLMIGQANTIVPQHLTDYSTTVTLIKGSKGSINGPASCGSTLTDFTFSGSMTVHNALKTGDKVHVLSLQNGKKFYVLDRV